MFRAALKNRGRLADTAQRLQMFIETLEANRSSTNAKANHRLFSAPIGRALALSIPVGSIGDTVVVSPSMTPLTSDVENRPMLA